MAGQPLAHLRMLVGCVVVDDGVDRLLDRHLRLDGIEEADELLVPVALHVAADDGTVEDVQSCEQRGRTVTFVVVGHRTGTARLHRQPWLGAVECLNLALFVDREDDRMGGRIDIEPTMLLSARQERPPARTRVAYARGNALTLRNDQ